MESTPLWRLLISPPASGPWNMAVDEAILESTARKDSLPTLRLYAWKPACLSLGYAQPVSDVDMERLKVQGWDLVRRPTGGRAILHVDEITYSVAGPASDPILAGSVLESYSRIAHALSEALRALGLEVMIKDQVGNSTKKTNPVCFEIPSTYEITTAGKKLVGSAQLRRSTGVLQHGSLPLFGDLTRIVEVLVFPSEKDRQHAKQRLLERAVTMEVAKGKPGSWDGAAQAFVTAFSSTQQINLIEGTLSPGELFRAEQLVTEKYNHSSWLTRI